MSHHIGSRTSQSSDQSVGDIADPNTVKRIWTDEEFRQVLESAPDAMVIVDNDGRIVFINAQTEEVFGYDRRELLGRPVEALMPTRFRDSHPGHVLDFFANARLRPMGACLGLYAVRKDGSEFSVEISLSPVQTAHGMLVSAAIRDVTERKCAEEQRSRYAAELERANLELERSNRELQDFAYVVSHDLRAPLVNIQGFSKELAMSCDRLRSRLAQMHLSDAERREVSELLDEDVPESLEFITKSSAKMDQLLSGVLKLSRVGRASLSMGHLDMNEMLAEIVASMQFAIDEQGVTVHLDALPPCHGDQTQVSQVFANLLDNAIKYLAPDRAGVIRVTGREEAETVTFSITDNGLGIAREHQDAIYKIFHRLDPHHGTGEGLGLTIVRRVVDRHSGGIWLESEPNRGSTFHISLPKVLSHAGDS